MNDWIRYKGGDCPVDPNKVVQVMLKGGASFTAKAGNINWSKDDRYTVIKYRLTGVIDVKES